MNKNVIDSAVVQDAETEIQEGDITMKEPVYTFRMLEGPDVFPMFKIIGKIGINDFSACFGKEAVQKLLVTLGTEDGVKNLPVALGVSITMELVNIVLNNISNCEQDIYQLLSRTSNLTVEEVQKLDFVTFTQMVLDFIRKDEFKDFIKVVSVLFK